MAKKKKVLKNNTPILTPDEIANKLNEALKVEAGLHALNKSPFTDDFCCKMLAYTLCFGGGNEAVTQNINVLFHIKVAQQRLNISGGEVPNIKLLPLLQKRIAELSKTGSKTEWLSELKSKFNLFIPDYDALPEYGVREKVTNISNNEFNLLTLLLLLQGK